MAAPALAASMHDCAICAGRHRNRRVPAGQSADPVTAHEIMTLRCMLVASHSSALGAAAWNSKARIGSRSQNPGDCVRRAAVSRATAPAHTSNSARAVLPPIVHCAKPRPSRPWNRSELRQGRFVRPAAPCGCRGRGGVSGRGGGVGGEVADERTVAGLSASRASSSRSRSASHWRCWSLPFLVAYKQPDPEKLSAYECGFNAFDDARMKFDVRFYLVAILFIIFDLEVTLPVPVGGRLRRARRLRLLVDDGVPWRSDRRLHL